jgi:DNA repair protein RadD
MCTEAADREHWMIFAAGTDHSDHIAEMLTYEFGIKAVSIHSKISSTERDSGIKRFLAGEYRCVVNNNVLTTGFDFPALDCIGVLRATESPVLWVQMLGRGTRPAPGKEDCLVLDFARNSRRLGPINDPKLPRRKGAGGGEAPIKECPICMTYNHPSVRFCMKCGYEFSFKVKIEQSASTDELIKSDIPQVEAWKVDHITYLKKERGKYPSLQVAYYCGFRVFYSHVCFEHPQGDFARKKAIDWWRERFPGGKDEMVPTKVDDALAYHDNIGIPPSTHLKIWVNKKYPEILKHCFDGTNFGTETPGLPPTSDIARTTAQRVDSFTDDDIPF